VTVLQSTYDEAVNKAFNESKRTKGGLLIQDNLFVGYEEIPAWIVEGYSTRLVEVEQQLSEPKTTHLITPIRSVLLDTQA
jgi:threonine dehydratase